MQLGGMFLDSSGFDQGLILLAMGAIGMIVGIAWLRRIAGPDPDREPSFWRYREVDEVPPPSTTDRLEPPNT